MDEDYEGYEHPLDDDERIVFLRARLADDAQTATEGRALRELAAKQAVLSSLERLVALHPHVAEDEHHRYYDTFWTTLWVLLQFAAVYDTHPDYRPDWRPRP